MTGSAPAPESAVTQVAEATVRLDVLIVEDSPSDAAMVRVALGIDAALTQITIDRSALLDADAVDACLRLFREQGFVLTSADDAVGWSYPIAAATEV